MSQIDVVTGAFSYTGKSITRRLLDLGRDVRTLTGHPDRPDPFGGRVKAFPFSFDDTGKLREALQGAETLYNNYWVRFNRGRVTFDRAVENSKILIRAAREAGIRRIVHVSITNPSLDSPLPYFRGKAQVEQFIQESGLSHSILRPTVIFGAEDILINNIAWFVRRFPVFGVFGTGEYRLQPIFVEDMADIAVSEGQSKGNGILDVVGPDIFTFRELVLLVAEKLRRNVKILKVPPQLAHLFGVIAGFIKRDVVITREEIIGLMADLLISGELPRGRTRLGDWLEENADRVGLRYASELRRHYR